MSPIRVLVVDDHALFRRGLVEVLAEESDLEVVGEAGDGHEAIQKVGELAPDVVFMDLNMPGQTGIETTAYLIQAFPEMKVLILTVSEEPAALFHALKVGALGYVLKTASPREIVEALHQVQQGWVVISPAMAPRFLSDLEQPAPQRAAAPAGAGAALGDIQLTHREQEILQHVARGLSNAEIANAIVVSENTVKTHIRNILGKLQLKNRSEAASYAARAGLTQPPRGEGPGRAG